MFTDGLGIEEAGGTGLLARFLAHICVFSKSRLFIRQRYELGRQWNVSQFDFLFIKESEASCTHGSFWFFRAIQKAAE